jgi:penicillin V acylase-like amidase (Ntn superfamily)
MKNLIILLLLNFSTEAISCTTFVLKDETNIVFGRILDWFSDNGIVVINKQNVKKTSLVFPPDKPISWTSKYGSVSFNQFGKEFPFGGINEKGLVIEIMVVNTSYPKYDNRPAVNELQWVQYQLDTCATIDDVIGTDKLFRISKIDQDLHFLICDKSGNTAVIEFSALGMIVYKGNDLPIPVLENDTYSNSLVSYKNKLDTRFTSANNMIKSYNPSDTASIIDYSFNILDEVTLDSSWSIVYDINNMQIHFKTASNRKVRQIDINSFDFNCNTKSLLYDLKNNKIGKLINTFFVNYSNKLNRKIITNAINSNNILLPKEILDQFYAYSSNCNCKVE